MASGKIKTRYPRIYKTPAGTYEWMVERPRRRGEPRLPPITGTCRLLEGPEGARAAQTNAAAALGGGTYVDRKTSPTVAEQLCGWQAKQRHRPGTEVIVKRTIALLEASDLGRMQLADAESEHYQAFIDDVEARNGPGRARSAATWLAAMCNAAVLQKHPVTRQALLASSPMKGVKRPAARPKVVRADRVLTVAQVNQFSDDYLTSEIGKPWQAALVRVQAGMGFRIGELLGLRVQDVDFLRQEIHLETQLNTAIRKRAELKTAKSVRTVPMPQWVAFTLAKQIKDYPPLRTDDGDLIFYQPRSGYVPEPHPYWGWGNDLSRAAATLHHADPTFPAMSSHDLRHHYVSLLIHKGLSAVAIGERIGDSPARVWDTYAHIWPGSKDDTRQAIDEAYGLTSPSSGTARQDPGDFRGTPGRLHSL